MPKATHAEVKKRVSKVADLLASGLTRAQILQYVADKTDWHSSERMVDDYISRATTEFKAQAAIDRQEQYARAIRRMESILAACLRVQDYARAIAAAKELHTLMALYDPPAKQTIYIEGLDTFQQFSALCQANGLDLQAMLLALKTQIEGK